MSIRSKIAASVGRAARWGGETFMHRTAGNIPGAIALKIDPLVLLDLIQGVDPVVVVSGTNGKTTTNNLIANCLAMSGRPLVCNREGNNLQSGVITALLARPQGGIGQSKGGRINAEGKSNPASGGCSLEGGCSLNSPEKPIASFECDELYTRFVLPRVRPRFFMLLNLFRDQLDRFGEIDRIQDVISKALAKTPETVFVYNGDDPLCAAIAERAPNASIVFGIEGNLGLSADRVSDSRFCQKCGGMLEYAYVHYDKLGAYRCKECGWERPPLDFAAGNVRMDEDGFVFDIDGRTVHTGQTGVYMIYNVLAAYVASKISGLVAFEDFQKSISTYRPTNGRLQVFDFGERSVMTNLAKNPTGFNQNIRIVLQEQGRVLALFVNDNDPDGHDVSWFWDIDFENWADIEGLKAFVGGIRANDMQVRLKYAGIKAHIVENVAEVMARTNAGDGRAYIIANYTALPEVRRDLEKMYETWKSTGKIPWSLSVPFYSGQDKQNSRYPESCEAPERDRASETSAKAQAAQSTTKTQAAQSITKVKALPDSLMSKGTVSASTKPLLIVHLFPELLNLYGDGGNVICLRRRLERRGLPVKVQEVGMGDAMDFSRADIVFIGGGADREQMIVKDAMAARKAELSAYVADGGVLLAVCGGYQFLGQSYVMDDVMVEGLGIVDIETVRGGGRLIGNAVVQSNICDAPIVGFENHGGRTTLGEGVHPLGRALGRTFGNNGQDGFEGVRQGNLIGTYLHGPLLPKNPQVADWLIARAYERRGDTVDLPPLDDIEEIAANRVMTKRLGVG